MLVGNKGDLHDAAKAEGQKHVPGYLGENGKSESGSTLEGVFHFCQP